ncbi:sirohydrochlorin chelatase [Actinocatenispora thailandica]|uniref:Sirohydrochlorin chelatase n=1 Tax=Actinocatenispora thailandica TaxID=227318 RepID=A0A7R7DS86_9ACTN|nr:sirohydrochlorin chelatase [Actinocatenispora thailandica]BCJ36884.1 sirohydrochlorin chelatase [Actinocatenispora thailandica]
MSTALLLVAHGSRDRRSGAAIDALAGRVAAARPGVPVATASLEHRGRRPVPVARELAAAGATGIVVVPLLLTEAYHSTVDVPAVTAEIRVALPQRPVARTAVLGPDGALLAALDHRLAELGVSGVDGLVLAAAGTRDPAARCGIAMVAAEFAARHGVAGSVAFAAGAGPDVSAAVGRLRSTGARRIAVVSYFLAPGRLHDRVVVGAEGCGVPVSAPFADTGPVAELVLRRARRARHPVVPQRSPLSVSVG